MCVCVFPAAQRVYRYASQVLAGFIGLKSARRSRDLEMEGGGEIGEQLHFMPSTSPGHVKSKVQAPKAVMLTMSDISGGPAQAESSSGSCAAGFSRE